MKKLGILMITVLLSICGMSTVHAADFTDMTNAQYQFVDDGTIGMDVKYFDLAITGAAFDKTHTYEVYLSNIDYASPDVDSDVFMKTIVTSSSLKLNSDNTTRVIEEAGDIYLWVRETVGSEKKLIASKVKLERPQLMLSKRIQTNFLFEKTIVNGLYPSSNNYAGRTATYKIGRVTDLSIVKAMNTKDEAKLKAALNRLLTYAKNDTGMHNGTVNLGTTESITKNMLDLEDDAYYYSYLVIDTDGGKYYEIEDVNLYQAVNCALKPNLNNYTLEEFKWPEERSCEIIDGKYYDKNGNVVDEETYNKECNPAPEKHVCEIVDGKYYGKEGVEVTEDTYNKECGTVTLPICEIVDGKYYGKDGNEIDKETYDKDCGTDKPVDNPNTGVYIGYGIAGVGILIGVGAYLHFKKEGKFPQA